MVQQINISIVFVTALFVIGTTGIGFFDFPSSSEEIDYFYDDPEIDDDTARMSFDDFKTFFDLRASADDEKWNEIDNLELIDYDEDELVEIEQLKQYSEVHGMTTYTLGKRIRGDAVVAVSARNQTWLQYQDIKSNMTYPANGVVGKNLTYIEIQVNQTSNLGQAYVVRGGVSKRFITIIVEAYRTLYFNFRATFYGL